MTGRRPVLPGGAAEDIGGSAAQVTEARRQGELWDEPTSGAPASQDHSGKGERSGVRTAAASADHPETQPDEVSERDAEAGGDTPAPDETLRVAHHLVGLLQEGGRITREALAATPEDESRPAEKPGDEGEGEAQPEEPAAGPAGEAGEAAAGAEGKASEQDRAGVATEAIQALQTFRADFGRWVEGERRSRRRWAGLAMAAGFPAALVLGALVEQQFQLVSLHDPTDGWGSRVWERYGWTIVECIREAMRTEAEVNCPLVVRWP